MDWDTARTFARALTRALLDSNETEQLLVGEEISSIGRMRITTREVEFTGLHALPQHTPGREHVDHLGRGGLDPDVRVRPASTWTAFAS
ncbi:hypothetical protein [Sandaracinus amylolyticus]|uniref:hypothetical protein n=1 Tax=Sandaracinus amylolyticus TaxID=927083 RepID=UPI001F302FB3|nr:hypothetical protein [Sandaracinus amylolyticus]UJR86346.1 Hypothetical protein I5071_84400 [Sandaracinus amylolyticus]